MKKPTRKEFFSANIRLHLLLERAGEISAQDQMSLSEVGELLDQLQATYELVEYGMALYGNDQPSDEYLPGLSLNPCKN